MDPLEDLTATASTLLGTVLKELGIEDTPEFADAPEGMGDIAYPCFPLARVLRKAPKIIAEELAEMCRKWIRSMEEGHGIARVDAISGYLNFTFDEHILIDRTLTSIHREKSDYGKGPSKGTSIILEHTSANPNGPFHVGRARNPIIGDTLGRILKFAGYDVTTEYYVNDMGKQAVTLAWGVEKFCEEEMRSGDDSDAKIDSGSQIVNPAGTWSQYGQKADHRLVGCYQKASALMEEDTTVLGKINGMLEAYERGDREIGETVRGYCTQVLDGMRTTLGKIHVHLDSYAYESKFVYNGKVTEVISTLNGSEHSHDDDTARYLELESFGVHGRDTRFFYTRKGGTSLYTTRDLAYHMEKFSRADRVIDILGEDHKLQAQQLAIALGELGEERRPEAIFYAFVSLPEGKMSTRKGRVVYLDQLIEEALELAYHEVSTKRPELSEADRRRISELVAIGAVRFNILRVQMEKSITFKWEEALSFDGDSAPFIQYSHARACSILRKAGIEPGEENGKEGGEGGEGKGGVGNGGGENGGVGAHEGITHDDVSLFADPYEVALIRELARFPTMVRGCAEGLKIHPMASYLRDLAQQFNQFYRECPVVIAEEPIRSARLDLVRSFRTVIANGLGLLGIDAPDSM